MMMDAVLMWVSAGFAAAVIYLLFGLNFLSSCFCYQDDQCKVCRSSGI